MSWDLVRPRSVLRYKVPPRFRPYRVAAGRLVRRHAGLRHVLPRGHRLYRVAAGRICLDLRESPMMFARVLRVYEPDKHAFLRTQLKPGMVFADVGANKGDFSLLAARAVGPSGAVHAVEPEPQNVICLRRTVEANRLANVTIHEVALGDSDGDATLYRGAVSGLHSLIPPRDDRGVWWVPLRRFDSLFSPLSLPPEVVKIDVEGAERLVIAGLGGLRPQLFVIDVHPARGVDLTALHAELEDLGYELSVRGYEWTAVRRL